MKNLFSRVGRGLKRPWLKRSLLVLMSLPLVLPLFLLSALSLPLTRAPIVALALDLTNDALDGTRIELLRVKRLDLWGIELSGLRMLDEQKRELVSVRSARLRIAPLSLVQSTLSLSDVRIEGVRIHLYPSDEPDEEEEEDSEPSRFQILAQRVLVKDLTFDMDLSGKALHAVLHELRAHGAYGPKTRAAIQKLSVEADLDGQHAAALRSDYARWDEKEGGKVGLSGDLLGAELRLAYVVPQITEATRWPLKEAELWLTNLQSEGLARVGYAELAELRVPVDLHVHAQTEGAQQEVLSAAVQLSAGKARLKLEGSASPSAYKLDLTLPATDLARVSGLLPELRAGLRLSLEARHDVTPMRVDAKWQDVSLDGRAVPNGSLSALLPLPVVRLERLSVDGLSHALALRGQYDTESQAAVVDLEMHALNLTSFGALLPEGSRGTLDGALHAAYTKEKLSGRGNLSLRSLRVSDASVDNARLTFQLLGTPRAPRGQLKLEAQKIASGETRLSRVALDLQAGLRDLDGTLQVEGDDRALSLILTGKRGADESLSVDATGTGRIRENKLRIRLDQLTIANGAYGLRELSAFSGKQRVYVSGALSKGGSVDVAVAIDNLDLAPWTRLALSEEITGTLDLKARAQGPLSAPDASADISLRAVHSLRAPRAPAVDLTTQLALDMRAHKATVTLAAHSPDQRVALKLDAEAKLGRRTQQLAAAFERADVALLLSGHTDVPFLAQFAPAELGELIGTLDADVKLKGNMDAAELTTKLRAELAPRAEATSAARDRIELDLTLVPERLSTTLVLQDHFGKMLDLAAEAAPPAGGPRGLLADTKALVHMPAELKLRLNERRLDKLQGTLGLFARKYGALLPVRVASDVALTSTGSALTGKVSVQSHVFGTGLDATCPEGAETDVTLEAELSGDALKAQLSARPKASGSALVTLSTKLAVNEILDGKPFAWGPARVVAHGDALLLHKLPGLCMLPESRTSFTLEAENLGQVPAEAVLKLDVDGVPTRDGSAMGLHLSARSAADAISAQGELTLSGAVKGRLSARVPLVYADSPVPSVPLDKPISAALSMPDFPLAGLTAFTEAIGRAGGRVKANLSLAGTLSEPKASGVIELNDASFSVAALAQPFSDVNARLELAADKLVIRKLTARDRSGKVSLTGYASYNPTRGGQAQLHLSADKFPIRQQGSIIGELSTRAVLEGKVDPSQKLSLTLDLKEGRIWMTGKGGRQVQELEEHPDVRYDTERVQLAEAAPESEAAPELTLAFLRIRSEKELWLMHEDFAVQVGVDMRFTTDEDGSMLQGEANITRGDLNLLGKPFRIEKGVVRFTGDVPPDPELDLKAKHTTRQGQTLIVQIQGRASAPQIIFSGAANNAGEAAMLLSGIGAGGAESKAKGDAASFAAGLTAGLLAVSARRRFGDWVPMLAIENNAAGAPSGARAGFDASRLIPKAMQGFARGMFVEGVVGARSDTGGSGAVGVGVRVELALPRDFMTSMGYGPGTVWSTDVYWSP